MGTYCGKSCEQCTYREQTGCPGCRQGPGEALSGGCEIAVCCRDKKHEHCGTCTQSNWCGKRSRSSDMPERRARKLAEQAEREAELERRAPILGRWMWILFWIWIPSAVAGLLSYESFAELAPTVYLIGKILSVVCILAYSLILFRLSKECERYRTAAILFLVAEVISMAIAPFQGAGWTVVPALINIVVSLVAQYQEYMGHSMLIRDFNETVSGEWRKLWKWFIGVYIVLLCSVVLMVIAPILGLLVALAALLGSLIVSILKLVHLYHTAQVLRGYSNK